MQALLRVLQQFENGLATGSLYALIAVGYTVVYGIIQLINFAHGEIFMIGAFGSITVWVLLGQGVSLWLLPLMLIGGILAAVVVSLLVERVAYRPLRNAPRLAPLISAIGVSVALQEAIRLFYGLIPGFPDSTSPISYPQLHLITGNAFSVGGIVNVQPADIFTFVALILCGGFLYYFVNRTRMGRAMQAVSQDPDTARLMGINVNRIIMVAFALGAALAAVAGVAQGFSVATIQFNMGFLAGLKAFTAAVLGGIGNIAGAILGGLVLGVAEAMVTFIPGQFGGFAWKDVWAFVLLILVLVFRPQGLLGARVVDRA